MLYVFYGTDGIKAQQKAIDTLHALQKKAPHASTVKLGGEEVTESSITDAIAEQGLFKSETLVYVDVRDEGLEVVLDMAKAAAASSNVVLVLAGKLKADELKKFEKTALAGQAAKCQEFEKEKKEAARNMFAITDLLYEKDAKSLFVELEKMRLEGTTGEEVIGLLFWAAKSMQLAGGSTSATESGLKPFVYQKAKRAASAWGEAGVKSLVQKLAHAPHKSRALGIDLFDELESIVLS
jgi:DNA polymerase III delta subunit